MAPKFKLKSYDDEEHELNDYSGKWIILDFWGTWCSPCRDELPKIQELTNKIKSEYNDKAVVLTIACKDKKDLVKEFMIKNNYNFNVLLSDKTVENNFEVSSYPSKFLITPKGKYLIFFLQIIGKKL